MGWVEFSSLSLVGLVNYSTVHRFKIALPCPPCVLLTCFCLHPTVPPSKVRLLTARSPRCRNNVGSRCIHRQGECTVTKSLSCGLWQTSCNLKVCPTSSLFAVRPCHVKLLPSTLLFSEHQQPPAPTGVFSIGWPGRCVFGVRHHGGPVSSSLQEGPLSRPAGASEALVD